MNKLSQKALDYFNSPSGQEAVKKYGQKYAPEIVEKINNWKLNQNQISQILGYMNWFNIKNLLLNPRAYIWSLAYPQAKKAWKFVFFRFKKQIIIGCVIFFIFLAWIIFLIYQLINYLINLGK